MLSELLHQGRTLHGCFIELPCPEAVEIAALAGWDFAIVDSEHGPIAESMFPGFVRAGDSRRMPVMIRVAENRPALIQQALDAGAAGVLIPQVSSYEAARSAVQASRFFPLGLRGVNGFVRAADYSNRPAQEYLATANRDTLCAVQLESAAACADAARIASIPGLDVLFIGPWDLSQSMGVPGQVSHPEVTREIQCVISICKAAGIFSGIYTSDPADAKSWADAGVQFIACQVDTLVLARGLRTLRDALR